jgi:hypothetical protein
VAAPLRKCCAASLAAQTGWSVTFLSLANRLTDGFQHRFRVFAENAIFKSENLKTLFLQISRALQLIVLAQYREVPRTVEFNNKRTFRTIEIDNIRTNAVLAAKLLAEKLTFLKMGPQHRLSCSSFITELFSFLFFFGLL